MAFNRVVVLVDMDCFYVQVEQRRDPSTIGKPCAVVQYKKFKGGGIIAVGYEARACGVTRGGMMGDEARKICPDIHLFRVPESNGKANLDRYREAGAEVINVLSQFGGRVERASIDEAYIDFTEVVNRAITQNKQHEYLDPEKLPNTHIVGWPEEVKDDEDQVTARDEGIRNWIKCAEANTENVEGVRLTIAAVITEEIRAAVYHQTGFRCSAGISHNKMLSKLACGINKPNKQTILPRNSIQGLFKTMKIGKVRNLGGKLGKSLMLNFDIEFMGELSAISMDRLIEAHGSKTACWLKEVSRGIDHEPVKERHVAQSIGCGKNFLGPDILNTKSKVRKWMDSLLIELSERLDKDKAANSRIARTLSVHLRLETGQSLSRSGPLSKYDHDELLKQSLQLIRPLDETSSGDERWRPGIISMSVNAKKFDPVGGSIISHTTPKDAKTDPDSNPVVARSQTLNNSIAKLFGNMESRHKKTDPVCPVLESGTELDSGKLRRNKSPKSSNSITDYLVQETSRNGKGPFPGSGSKEEHESGKLKHTKYQQLSNATKGFFGNRMIGRREEECGASFSSKADPDFQNTKTNSHSKVKPEPEIICTKDKAITKLMHSEPKDQTNETSFVKYFSKAKSSEILHGDRNGEVSGKEDDDVIFVGGQQPDDLSDFVSDFKESETTKKAGLCKIDTMLLEESENTQPKTSKYNLPDGPIFHPLYGEIDRDVFQDLPPDIQEEISKSYKITSSIIPSSQTPSSSQKLLNINKNQRLISNFIPQSQNTPPKSSSKEKRKSTDPSPGRAKKHKTGSSTKKSPSSKSKEPIFASKSKSDAMPLGFFRQRSQLSNAITKALTKDPPKFLQ